MQASLINALNLLPHILGQRAAGEGASERGWVGRCGGARSKRQGANKLHKRDPTLGR